MSRRQSRTYSTARVVSSASDSSTESEASRVIRPQGLRSLYSTGHDAPNNPSPPGHELDDFTRGHSAHRQHGQHPSDQETQEGASSRGSSRGGHHRHSSGGHSAQVFRLPWYAKKKSYVVRFPGSDLGNAAVLTCSCHHHPGARLPARVCEWSMFSCAKGTA